jgi:hypothetical protein
MIRLLSIAALILPTCASAADLVSYQTSSQTTVVMARNCHIDEIGQKYCVEVPLEKIITDCEPGMNCTHMQSGQHYSQQSPVIAAN